MERPGCRGRREKKRVKTYTKDRGVVGHRRGLLLLDGRGALFDPQVLDIGAAEDDIFVQLLRCRDELVGAAFPVLGTKRPHVLEGDSRVIRVDTVEGARVPDVAPGYEGYSGSAGRGRGCQ